MSPDLIRGILALSVFAWMLRKGCRRRRAAWTAHSWKRFGLLLGGSLCALVLALAMARGVDNGIYDHMPRFAHDVYFAILMALALGGPLSLFGLIAWFAGGRADRQLGRQSVSRGL